MYKNSILKNTIQISTYYVGMADS